MAKLGVLISNEQKKIWSRWTIRVMMILLVLAAGGIVLLNTVFGRWLEDDYYYWGSYSLQDECESELKYYRELPEEYAEQSDAKYWIAYYEFLIEIGAERDDWRYTSGAVTRAISLISDDENDPDGLSMLDGLRKNDYKIYCQAVLNQIEGFGMEKGYTEAMAFAFRYCLDHEICPDPDDWRYEKATEVSNCMTNIYVLEEQAKSGVEISADKLEDARNQKALALYQLEHDVPINPADSFKKSSLLSIDYSQTQQTSCFWDAMKSSVSLVSVAGLFMIIIAGSIVAVEFQKGTVKFLLLIPAKRSKILLAKYLTVLINGLIMVAVLFGFSILFGMLFCGASDAFLPSLTVSNGVVSTSSPYLTLMKQYLLSSVNILVMSTLAFAISSLLRNSAIATGVSIMALLSGNLLISMLALFGQDWARYLIFANLDFSTIGSELSLFPHQSMTTAVIIVALHMIVFIWTAFDGFTRREV